MLEALTPWAIAAIVAKTIAYLASFLAAGSALYALANPRLTDEIASSLGSVIAVAAPVAILAAAARISIQAGRLLDDGFAGMVDAEMLQLVIDTPLGQSAIVRMVGLALLLVPLAMRRRSGLASVLSGAGGLLTVISFTLVGHSTNEPRWLLAALVIVHLLAVSFWLGALWPLKKAAGGAMDVSDAGELAHRFGNQAAFVVGILIAAGLVLIYQFVGSWSALFGSQYGLTLVVKLVAASLLLSLAAANKTRFVPAMREGDGRAADHLRRSIALEATLFVLIFAVSAVLTTLTGLPSETGSGSMEMMNDG